MHFGTKHAQIKSNGNDWTIQKLALLQSIIAYLAGFHTEDYMKILEEMGTRKTVSSSWKGWLESNIHAKKSL